MTYPNTYYSIKKLMAAQIFMLTGEIFTILVTILTASVFNMNITIDNAISPAGLALYGITLLFLAVRILGYIFYIIGLRKANKDDANFKIAFYSIIITLILAVVSVVFVFNKEVYSIGELLVILTIMLSQIYILEGIRSLSKQLGHPEMDKTGAAIYAIIVTIFVIRTCVSILILILIDNSSSVETSIFEVIDSALSIGESVLFLFYFSKALKIFSKE